MPSSHVNPQLTKDRERRAHALRLEGHSFVAIGQRIGITREGARKAVMRRERAIEAASIEEILAVRAAIGWRLLRVYEVCLREYRQAKTSLDLADSRFLETARQALADALEVWPSGEPKKWARAGKQVPERPLQHDLSDHLHRTYGNPTIRDLFRSLEMSHSRARKRPPALPPSSESDHLGIVEQRCGVEPNDPRATQPFTLA